MPLHAAQHVEDTHSRMGQHAAPEKPAFSITRKQRFALIAVIAVVVCALVAFGVFKLVEYQMQVAAEAVAQAEQERLEAEAAEAAERAAAEKLASFPEKFTWAENAPVVLQYPILSAGCETCSLAALLGSMGYEVDPVDLVEEYLDYGWNQTFDVGFVGDPYYSGVGFPPAMITCGNRFLSDQDSIYRLQDYSGCSLDKLIEFTDRGLPVMVWTTTDYLYSWYGSWSGYGYWYGNGYGGYGADGPGGASGPGGSNGSSVSSDSSSAAYSWYNNEHCVLLVSATDDQVTVMDPESGFVSCSREQFESVYNSCGKFAVSIALE